MRALSLYLKDNRLILREFFDWHKEEDLAVFFKSLKFRKDSNVIFLHDNSMAVTFAGLVKLEKNNFRSPITEGDLQTFLGAATRQFFNRFREEAKRRLAVSDVDVILANNRFLSLNLNGKPVINPLGQTARFAEIEIEQTYLSRHFWDAISEYTEKQSNVFHIECAGALRDSLALLYPERKILLATVSSHITKVFSCGGKNRYFGAVSFPKMQYRGEFALGSDDLLELLVARFHIEKQVAEELLWLYVEGGMSKHLRHIFEKLITLYLARFESEISRFLKKEHMCVISSDIPFLTAGQKIQHQEAVHLAFPDLASRLNLQVKNSRFLTRQTFSPVYLSGLIAYFKRTSDNYLSGLAKERMRWLQPENSA
ncbi:MAG: hypothetical protein Q8P97_00535 [bacterium]|nr:hypothetical protein [bacterium]